MDIEKYRKYCLSKKQATESFPFPSLPNILVFKVVDKMFTATDVNTFESFSIKHDPDTIDNLRSKFDAVTNHTYFSNKHWSKLLMDKSIPDKILFELLDTSYNLTVAKLTKKTRNEMGL
ncbi:MmcQ/YjbR family DNA-binding protein [Flavobacterium sp. GA093]|uniref:MmcQ/YjbR family DNA-binding protein n=1 Tax=Flavobacterium hydrocarbonoxydans TaxID=2683249 RepID=A0A6I4NMR5_9FLAO|nr:MmcQ/YjbR family DNA-binding protein [Flavobacterium hydrocarbonoxydans]MWB95411.1 MmcQ/YjbR family DNA-binding protein [Flavobacterium hydrocarbonoxydans]